MKKTDYKSGWTTTAWIERRKDTAYAFYNEFTDDNTNELLNDVSLFVSRVNFKHRGNETDELYKYNRESSPSKFNKVWRKYDKEIENAIKEIKYLSEKYNIKIEIK